MDKVLKSSTRYNEIVFTYEEEEKICNIYKSGMSTVKIGKEFGVSHKKIARILDSYGIKRVGNGRRKYSLNENYFDKIDTPNKAYVLGFLYADGNNNLTKQTISMSLQEDDFEILEAIRKEIGSEKPLKFIDYSNKHDFGYTYKNQYRLLMHSKHMSETLRDLGMVPNKSLVLEFPKIDPELYSHFIRGYFDGDGSVHFSTTIHSNCLVTITSTLPFCEKIKAILETELKVHIGIRDASNNNGITKVAYVSGKNQLKKIYNYLYKDASLFMSRKYQKFFSQYGEVNN